MIELETDIQKAARFFYLQHHAFGAKATGQTFGTASTGRAINLLRACQAYVRAVAP